MPLLAMVALFSQISLQAQDQGDGLGLPLNPFFFHDGDKPVVFVGEGSTEQRMYTTLIETYTLTRFPDWNITFRNAGWDGDTVTLSKRGDYDASLARDVLALHPKVVTLSFGMTDSGAGETGLSDYTKGLTKQVKDVEAAGARVALFSPTPKEGFEFQAPAGNHDNSSIKKYVDGMKIVSDNERVPFIDLYTPLLNLIEAGRKCGVLGASVDAVDLGATRLTIDGTHPNWGAHLVMATVILQRFRAPALVSSVSVDAAARSISSSQDCVVEWQDVPNGALQIKRTDRALPWPLPDDPAIDLALKLPGFDPATALNRYEYKVTGLKPGYYKLTIDGAEIGTYLGSDLARGINLGFVKQGPIYDQEQQLLQAVTAKNEAYYNRWRNVQLYQTPGWLQGPGLEGARSAEMARLDKVISDAEDNIETLRKPVTHVFRLDPVAPAPGK